MSATPADIARVLPGDDVLPAARLVLDRVTVLAATPERIWPWLVQLGKDRAGWYLPAAVEAVLPPARRAARLVDQRWQGLQVGDRIPDWGGRDASFEALVVDPPRALVYRTERGQDADPLVATWALVLRPLTETSTQLHLRLRGQRASWRDSRWLRTKLAAGDLIDLATVAPLFVGLRERLRDTAPLA